MMNFIIISENCTMTKMSTHQIIICITNLCTRNFVEYFTESEVSNSIKD